jgi:serine/threonine protein phosphatase PrpC
MSGYVIHSDQAVVQAGDVDAGDHAALATPLGVRSFGLTDPGKVRENNEDQFLIATLVKALQVERTSLPAGPLQRGGDRSHLFVVADGIGGGAGGEQASALAIESVESFVVDVFQWFRQLRGGEEDKVLADFQSALSHANAQVLAEASRNPGLRGMGTTLTLAYSQNDMLFVAHVGDSRCYLHRGDILHRLTRDHTLVEELVRRGVLPAEQAAGHRWRHVITNAVGGDSTEVRVDVHKLRLEAGDAVLLCSDGLTEMVSEAELARTLQAEADVEQACRRLVGRANEEGGRDNITVVLARYEAVA